MEVSIIICCYNGKSHLRPTLEYIARQRYDANLGVEFIFVDNASTDGSAAYVQNIWNELHPKMALRIVREEESGLIYARRCGVRAAEGKYIIFCDDDNWLREDYIQTAYELMEAMPNVGVLGGQSVLAPGLDVPDWWEEQQGNYAVGKQMSQTSIANERGFLYGAGMVTRADLARRVLVGEYPFLLTGRTGDQCLSGEDWEYCMRAMILGWDLYYSEDLFYWHDVDSKRLTKDQLEKLLHSFALGAKIQEKYQYALTYMQSSVTNHIAWLFIRLWNVITVNKANRTRKKELLHMHACMMGIDREDREMNIIKGFIQTKES